MMEFQLKIGHLRDQLEAYSDEVHNTPEGALCMTAGEIFEGVEDAFEEFLYRSEVSWKA